MEAHEKRPLRIGVSSCLLGAEVRFDGGHKRDVFVADELGAYAELVAVCPEMEIGLGVPRETLRLEQRGSEVRLVAPGSGTDHTRAMERWSRRRLRELVRLDLDGWVLKKSSPSCGFEHVRVYRAPAPPRHDGRGLFASALRAALPDLPIEEEGHLRDPRLRENFVERLFAYRRLKDMFDRRWTLADLVRFHAREKLRLLAHDPEGCRRLGRLVAGVEGKDRASFAAEYRATFMGALGRLATRGRHAHPEELMLRKHV